MAQTHNIIGRIKSIAPTQTVGSSNFQKRAFVVTIPDEKDSKWDQHIQLEFIKDKCSILDGYRTGENVEISFNIRGSEYNGRSFVNLQAFKIERVPGHAGEPPQETHNRNRPRQQQRPDTDRNQQPAGSGDDSDRDIDF